MTTYVPESSIELIPKTSRLDDIIITTFWTSEGRLVRTVIQQPNGDKIIVTKLEDDQFAQKVITPSSIVTLIGYLDYSRGLKFCGLPVGWCSRTTLTPDTLISQTFVGNFVRGLLQGAGKIINSDGGFADVQFVDDNQVGTGRHYDKNEDLCQISYTVGVGELSTVDVIVRPQCDICRSPTIGTCGRCHQVMYCGDFCQLQHWQAGHKGECHAHP